MNKKEMLCEEDWGVYGAPKVKLPSKPLLKNDEEDWGLSSAEELWKPNEPLKVYPDKGAPSFPPTTETIYASKKVSDELFPLLIAFFAGCTIGAMAVSNF